MAHIIQRLHVNIVWIGIQNGDVITRCNDYSNSNSHSHYKIEMHLYQHDSFGVHRNAQCNLYCKELNKKYEYFN